MNWKYKLGIGIFILDVIVSLYVWIIEPLPEARGLIIMHCFAYLLCLWVIGVAVILSYIDGKINKKPLG